MKMIILAFSAALFLFCNISNSSAQIESIAKKKLIESIGLEISFIFYSEGDGIENNGVVIFLENKNEFSIKYKFKLIFRADTLDHSENVEGFLKPGKKITGSTAGLFWIPFKDKRTITQVGIQGLKVNKAEIN